MASTSRALATSVLLLQPADVLRVPCEQAGSAEVTPHFLQTSLGCDFDGVSHALSSVLGLLAQNAKVCKGLTVRMSWVFRCHLASTSWQSARCVPMVRVERQPLHNQSLVLQLPGEGKRCVWQVHFKRAFV
jgi:hypothetical protein